MATRSVDFTSDIIKGESIVFSFAADSKVDIVGVDGINITYTYPYSVIDTSNWKAGAYTAIINDKTFSVRTFQILDPTATANKYNQYLSIIDEINIVIESKVQGGGVITQSINNKSLTTESMDALLKLRTHYTRLANQELARMRGLSSGNPIKSITTFNRGN
ncbi:hypothetical protein AABV78_001440 [Enterobacter hormaechei]|uniref:hypothetical protein n=1 Tax=Enterobacter kobei TaxID=208224 RepID=UPI00277B6698|nr:hypothetical protein [Cronobacter dublinensis]ELC6602304.1 hypothetical protein [Enterobacter hormaechei]ELY4003052.1 hypothetical protein [Cronobacter dublinensis]